MSSSFEFGDWIFLLTSIFETLMFCGFQTGWSSLVYVLVEEGIYSHLCINENSVNSLEWNSTNSSSNVQPIRNVTENNNCIAQQEMLNLAYTLATSVSSLAAFPIGVAMDCIGPRFTRIISGFLLGFSSFLLSYLNKQNPGILFIGLIVACIANIIMFMTPQACMQRFKKGRSMLIGLYCGAWVTSSLAFLGFKVLYENGGVSVAYFFRFLAVGCVFLCINAALLYPDSAIPPRDEKSENKLTVRQKPFKKAKHSCFKEELQKCKLCLGHMINGRKENSFDNSAKADQGSNEWNQLIPNHISNSEKATDLSSSVQTNDTYSESCNRQICDVSGKNSSNAIQLTSTKTVLDLSERQNPASSILGNCGDIKRVTYAECPTLSSCSGSKDSEQLCEGLDLERSHVEVGQNADPKRAPKTTRVVQNDCQKRDEEIQPKSDQKPCEIKDALDNRSADLQVWTAVSAVSYLKSGISFKSCVMSTLHILAQVFLTVCKIRTLFFVGTFSNFISDLCGGDRSTVARYVNIFGISHVSGMVMAPLFGYIIDRQCSHNADDYVKPSKDTDKQHQKFMMDIEDTPKVMNFIIQCSRKKIFKLNDAVLVTVSSSVVFCLMSLIPSLTVQIVTFQLYVFVKVAFDTVFTSIVVVIFPQNHLGKLMGLAALIGAIFSLIQYPLFIVMEVWFGGRTIEVNIFLWLLSLLGFGFPIYLWRKASRQEPPSLALVAV